METKLYKEITKCRCCGSGNLKEYLDLGEQPLANDYHNGTADQDVFPLKALFCPTCSHSQLSVVVDPDILFRHYLYVSGTSTTLRDYFEFFAEFAVEMYWAAFRAPPNSILDIACNDGSQLDAFKHHQFRTIGVDPAKNLTPIAKAKGHEILTDYWTPDTAEVLFNRSGPIDILVAQNVFAHTHDVLWFLRACQKVMDKKSVLFIQTSQAEMIRRNEFDTMYHEHLSFFNVKSMQTLIQSAGLSLDAVYKTAIHGTSYVFIISLHGIEFPDNDTVERELKLEHAEGLGDFATYEQFATNAIHCTQTLKHRVANHRKAGKQVVGYGAAAKGNTVLNFGDIELDYIIDDSSLKQGLLTPGTNIPICGRQKLLDDPSDKVFVPLAWNFFDEIAQKVNECTGTSNTFIRYFPTFEEVVI